MAIEQLFAQYGFTVEKPHTCMDTGNPMRAFFAPNDSYEDTACYIDTVTGEVEIDVSGGGIFFGSPSDPRLVEALQQAKEDVEKWS